MALIYLALDKQCLTQQKVDADILGGTERFFILLERYLQSQGLEVFRDFGEESLRQYDVCIHSNRFNSQVTAKFHILWGGSWHMTTGAPVDVTIVNSQYMKDQLGFTNALVIPAPYDREILKHRTDVFLPNSIITTSNPNRHIAHTRQISKKLEDRGHEFRWYLTGGNKLYSENFMEYFEIPSTNHLKYVGVIGRGALVNLLSTILVYVYPNLTDKSETECVSALEAAALGLSVILPKRRPFVDILPQATFCSTEDEFVDAIEAALKVTDRQTYSLLDYDEKTVFPKILREIDGLIFDNTID